MPAPVIAQRGEITPVTSQAARPASCSPPHVVSLDMPARVIAPLAKKDAPAHYAPALVPLHTPGESAQKMGAPYSRASVKNKSSHHTCERVPAACSRPARGEPRPKHPDRRAAQEESPSMSTRERVPLRGRALRTGLHKCRRKTRTAGRLVGRTPYLAFPMSSRKRVGVVGVSGYGGGEILRLCAQHPVEVVYAAGETSAGQRLGSRYPGLGGALADLTIQAFDPRNLPDLDLLFLSLPTGDSRKAAAVAAADLKVIDVGGDHRFVDGWTLRPDRGHWPGDDRRSQPRRRPRLLPRRGAAGAGAAGRQRPGRAHAASSSTPRPASAAPAAAAARPSALPKSTRTSPPTTCSSTPTPPRCARPSRAWLAAQPASRGLHRPPGADDPRHPGHLLRPRPR